MMFIKPLKPAAADTDDGIQSRYISIEVIDGTVFYDLYKWEEKVPQTQAMILSEQMSRMPQITDSFPVLTGAESELELAADILDTLNQSQATIQSGVSDRPQDWILVDTQPILQAAIRGCRDRCESRGVRIKIHSQPENSEAISNPVLLRRGLAIILDGLLNDASRQSEIAIRIQKQQDRLCYSFEIETPSTPATATSANVMGKAAAILVQQQTDRFVEVATWLEYWQASLRITCGTRYQLSIELELACSVKDLLAKQTASRPNLPRPVWCAEESTAQPGLPPAT